MEISIWEDHVPLDHQPQLKLVSLNDNICLQGLLLVEQKSHPFVPYLLSSFALNETLLCIFMSQLCHFLSTLSLLLSIFAQILVQ